MIRAFQVLDALLVQEPLRPEKILEPEDGGGKTKVKKNVACMLLKLKPKVRSGKIKPEVEN
jgi:hypothetical protein